MITSMVTNIYTSKNPRKLGMLIGEVIIDNEAIAFKIEKPVWQSPSAILEKGNWVTLDDIRPHGKQAKKRAYYARLAFDTEVKNCINEMAYPKKERTKESFPARIIVQ